MRGFAIIAIALACGLLAARAAPTNSSPQNTSVTLSAASAVTAAAYKPKFNLTSARGTEVSNSLVFVDIFEIRDKCQEMVDRSWATGSRKIQIVPTIHWVGTSTTVSSWCYREWYHCKDVTNWDQIWYFKDIVKSCIEKAVNKGYRQIYVLPHNDVKDGYVWRNMLDFDPLAKYGGFSYYDALILPVAEAMRAVWDKDPARIKVWFTLEGETGLSLFKYPARWKTALDRSKAHLTQNNRKLQANAKVGLSFNMNLICGCVRFETGGSNYVYAQKYPSEFKKANPKLDFKAIKSMLMRSEFIGVSAYTGLFYGRPVSDLELPLSWFNTEVTIKGVSLHTLIYRLNKPLLISEWGFGGGDASGEVATRDVTYAVTKPFFGTWGDPTQDARNPWVYKPVADARNHLYKNALAWLKQQGGPNYRITSLFQWNAGSWDIQAVRYDSYANGKSWRHPGIYDMVLNHNKYVNRL